MPPPPPKRNKGKFWLGVVLALPAVLVAAFLFGGLMSLLSSADVPGGLMNVAALVVLTLLLTGLVALIVVERTRWIGLGLLAGTAIWAIVAAGACIVLIAAITSSYNA
jgi:hypothetical protein